MNHPIQIKSPSKVNLGLRIENKRSDGYHNLHSLFIELVFGDELTLTPSESFSISCEGIDIPLDETNLISKAYKVLQPQRPKSFPEYKIKVNKKIPVGAGLGGGSSNAAATLKVLNRLWKLKLSNQKLETFGKTLGADVPFFIKGGFQLAEGIGDKLTPLKSDPLKKLIFLLVVPTIHISTDWAYQNVNSLLTGVESLPKFAPLETPMNWRIFENDFEKVVISAYPEIGTIKQGLLKAGALWAGLSGSGSTVYGIFSSTEFDREIEKEFSASYHTILTKPKIKSG